MRQLTIKAGLYGCLQSYAPGSAILCQGKHGKLSKEPIIPGSSGHTPEPCLVGPRHQPACRLGPPSTRSCLCLEGGLQQPHAAAWLLQPAADVRLLEVPRTGGMRCSMRQVSGGGEYGAKQAGHVDAPFVDVWAGTARTPVCLQSSERLNIVMITIGTGDTCRRTD